MQVNIDVYVCRRAKLVYVERYPWIYAPGSDGDGGLKVFLRTELWPTNTAAFKYLFLCTYIYTCIQKTGKGFYVKISKSFCTVCDIAFSKKNKNTYTNTHTNI